MNAKKLVDELIDDVKDFVVDFGVQGINPEALEPLFELTVSKHLPANEAKESPPLPPAAP